MGSPPAICSQCGLKFATPGIEINDSTDITFVGGKTRCPKCGAPADIVDGTYDFVGNVISAFRAPGMTRQKVAAARDIAQEASRGEITVNDAIIRLEAISSQLAAAAHASSGSRIDWGLLLALLVFLYTIWTDLGSDADAQAELGEARTQTAIAQKMLEAQHETSAALHSWAPTSQLQVPALGQTPDRVTRQQRRRAEQIARKRNRPEP